MSKQQQKAEGLRFFDLIMRSRSVPDEIKDSLDGVPVIDGTNVARYYYEASDQEYWDLSDFPNIAPPFPDFWLDFQAPDRIVSGKEGILEWRETGNAKRWGLRCRGVLLSSETKDTFLDEPYWQNERDYFAAWLGVAKWGVDLWMGLHLNERFIVPSWIGRVLVAEDGRPVYDSRNQPVMASASTNVVLQPVHSGVPDIDAEQQEEMYQMVTRSMFPYFHCGMLTLSFLHCRNVVLEDVNPPSKTIHNKSQRRRGEKPYQPIPYKILDIKPMRQVLQSEGRSDEVGMRKSLHICRGHFKHYENGRGLFGKLKGTYFFPMQVRGSKERGVVTKDYRIDLENAETLFS